MFRKYSVNVKKIKNNNNCSAGKICWAFESLYYKVPPGGPRWQLVYQPTNKQKESGVLDPRAGVARLPTHQWWAAQRGQACRRRGKSTWASSHSSAGKRLRRNTEDGRKLKLCTAHQVASSPAGKSQRRRKMQIKLIKNTDQVRFNGYSYWTD